MTRKSLFVIFVLHIVIINITLYGVAYAATVNAQHIISFVQFVTKIGKHFFSTQRWPYIRRSPRGCAFPMHKHRHNTTVCRLTYFFKIRQSVTIRKKSIWPRWIHIVNTLYGICYNKRRIGVPLWKVLVFFYR